MPPRDLSEGQFPPHFGFSWSQDQQAVPSPVCCPPFGMCDLDGVELEHEIQVVSRQLAFVNHKLQFQMQTMKDLLHEYEASLTVDEMVDSLGYPFSLGSRMMDPAQPLLYPTPCGTNIQSADMNMAELRAALLPLLQYDEFSWRGQIAETKMGDPPKLAEPNTNPPCSHVRAKDVPVAILGGKEVDMPYRLWENLHRQIVCTRNARFVKSRHPMLYIFYKSMEAQLCAITKCHPELHSKIPPVPKFLK